MSKFLGVSVVREANIYFDGKVTSRTIEFPDGGVKTLGIMLPGDYEFGTAKPEKMEIQAGRLMVLLPGEADWRQVEAGDSFDVAGNAKFKLKVTEVVDYCCTYIG